MSKDMIGASRHLSPTETGLEVHGTPSEQEWQDMGIALGRADKALQWLIGDWYNQVPWGDKKAACERVGLKYTDARDYGSVAAKFQMSERSDILDFGHHRKAASLPTTEERTEVLNLAAQENWTVNQVREEVNERKKSTAPDKVKKFSMGWQTGILNHSEYKEVIGSRQLADNKKKVEDLSLIHI